MSSNVSIDSLENLGRVRLSRSFFMRDFLYSEISNQHRISNIPDDPQLAIEVGKRLCKEILEPLQATFGRVHIRSAYRSAAVNAFGNEHELKCGANEKNFAAHIWDRLDAQGCRGAMACIVLPWFLDRYERGADWRSLAYWIHNHLPYSGVTFFPKLCAFNIGWHERPKRSIYSYIEPKGYLLRDAPIDEAFAETYADFPSFAP